MTCERLPFCKPDRCPDNYGRTVACDLRSPGERSAWWRLDNCYSDYAVVNARQLDALLRGEDPDAAAEQLRLQAQRPGG
jgi:hypothetical protein